MFKTKRLQINIFTEDDILPLYQYRSKPEVSEFQSWNRYTIKNARNRIQYCIKHPFTKLSKNYQLAIRKLDGTLIGDIYLEPVTLKNITIGYTLDSAYWKQGYGSEVLEGLLKWLKEEHEYTVITCHVYNDNISSLRLLEKYGFEEYQRSKFLGDISFKKKL